MRVIRSLCIAFSTYSRIPAPQVEWSDENRKYSMCFFPLIGAVIGLLLWGWLWLCEALAIGPVLKGAAGALLPVLVTGGIHMDGFMDTSDALASWQSRERRLEILKDSHVGAFAVLRGIPAAARGAAERSGGGLRRHAGLCVRAVPCAERLGDGRLQERAAQRYAGRLCACGT